MSDRRDDLLRQAYAYALEHGLADLSLRPLAAAIGSSPRVLLFLFGSKDGLVRELLARARADQLVLLDQARGGGLAEVMEAVWSWLAAPEHRALLTLWLEGYSRSLVAPDGPWTDFARTTVEDWLKVLADAQPASDTKAAETERTLALAVLRGALLDLLATGDVERTTAAVRSIMTGYGQT
ncbi:TetR/AcrR family transcriptional regulator [Kutzneria sp. 744]|uniref:TetR/AcrR family transcriptional regulator n=1 Tax=Kutzneria sp. (strain 744) TaxID=345341 RepID=UPI0003EEC08F|nr:TetR/AcrR family transcriptional regulator [Kutzneria sp. 744]EWM09791.1 transcriptional regulator, TetR family [Kutzneria sp. 744]